MIGKYPTYVEMANAIRAAVSALSGGLPAGGSTGEVLTKASATDYDATWQAAPSSPNGLPTGGTANQLLVKNSATNYDASFATVGTVPTGGTFAQSLVKQSATNYDVVWGNPTAPNGLPTGGTAGQALIKSSATNYDAAFTTIGTLPVGGTTLQLLAKSSATDYTTSWVSFASYANTLLRTVKDTTSRTSTSNVTLTATGLTFTVTSGQMYHLKAMGQFQSAATTTGLTLGFSTTVATTYASWSAQIEQAAAGVDSAHVGYATALTGVVTSSAVVAINTSYGWEMEGYFEPSANGTVTIGFRSEVNASQVTWRPGAVAILTNIG